MPKGNFVSTHAEIVNDAVKLLSIHLALTFQGFSISYGSSPFFQCCI